MRASVDSQSEIEDRMVSYAQRLFRIEAHLKRREVRAAKAQLSGFLDELVVFSDEMLFPVESVLAGAKLGFLTGPPFFRGRLPSLLLGAVGGWIWGQHRASSYRLQLHQIIDRVEELHINLNPSLAVDPDLHARGV